MEHTAALLARIGGIRLALPRRHYAEKIAAGELSDLDLAEALQASTLSSRMNIDGVKKAVLREPQIPQALPTIVDLAADISQKDWRGLVTDRIGTFAAGFFDQGQALWAASRHNGIYAAWRPLPRTI